MVICVSIQKQVLLLFWILYVIYLSNWSKESSTVFYFLEEEPLHIDTIHLLTCVNKTFSVLSTSFARCMYTVPRARWSLTLVLLFTRLHAETGVLCGLSSMEGKPHGLIISGPVLSPWCRNLMIGTAQSSGLAAVSLKTIYRTKYTH